MMFCTTFLSMPFQGFVDHGSPERAHGCLLTPQQCLVLPEDKELLASWSQPALCSSVGLERSGRVVSDVVVQPLGDKKQGQSVPLGVERRGQRVHLRGERIPLGGQEEGAWSLQGTRGGPRVLCGVLTP